MTNGRNVSYFQSFSPDGKTVVFESREGAGPHLRKTERGAVPFQLTADPNFDDTYPRWSPDGHSIAFNRRPVKEPQAVYGLWLMTDDGANPRLLIEKAANCAWMPDGRALVYFSLVDLQLYLDKVTSRVVSLLGPREHRLRLA
jgi:Tol biopolymer transport system component